jgi:hypothetical protein
MNLTDADLTKFFLSKLARLQPEVSPFVPEKADAKCESYFQDVFEPEPIVSQDDMISSLVGIWDRQGLGALVALEPDLRKMAKELRATDEKSQKVSNFIYAMY